MIIGICGRAQNGKDTIGKMLADALFDKTGNKYVLMAYATELKKRVQKDFDLSYEQLWGSSKEVPDHRYPKNRNNHIAGRRDTDEIKENYWTPREILQEYGQFFRTIDYDFWVKALFNTIDEKAYKNVILTDVRHPNEADPVKKRNGCTIKIERNVETWVHNQNHISETAMNKYKVDFEVKNFGDLSDLRQTAIALADAVVSSVNTTKEIKIIGG